MKKEHKKKLNIEKLPAYFFRISLLSISLLLFFILLLSQSWLVIHKNEQHLNQYYLPAISILFQAQNQLHELEHKVSKTLNLSTDVNIDATTFQYNALSDDKYQLDLLSKKLTSLEQKYFDLEFEQAFLRFKRQTEKLSISLANKKEVDDLTSESLSLSVLQTKNYAEQLRRLYEVRANKLSEELKQQRKNLFWKLPVFIVLFSLIFAVIINKAITAIKEVIAKQKQQHNNALEQERLLFKIIFESSPNGLVIANSKGKIINANQEMEYLFKYSLEELIGLEVEDLMPSRFKHHHKKNITAYMEHPVERPMAKEKKLVAADKNGEEFPVEIGLTPIKMAGQQEFYVLATITDISQRKKNEYELLVSKKEAEKANIAKSVFLSQMSHELRTPLNAILGFGQLIEMDDENSLTEEQLDNLHEILSAGKHLLSLIDEILDLSKIEAGKVNMSLQDYPLTELLNECLTLVKAQADKAGIKIYNQITEHYLIYADKLRFKQIMLNLITNAIKYNRIHGTVTLKAEFNREEKIRISVIDQGKGLSGDQQNRLFKAFERLGAETTEIQGTGIGLVVTKQLIELMNGNIGIDSAPDAGSTFWIEIKAKKLISQTL